MTLVLFKRNGVVSLGPISKEEDLMPGNGFIINPPPRHTRCDVCGRHISELKPFGGFGDPLPLVGDFSGELLVKSFRPAGPYDAEAENAWEEYEKEHPGNELPVKFDGISFVEYEEREDPIHWFINKFGEDKGERLYRSVQACYCISGSWECRDCIELDDDEYFEKLDQRFREQGDN